MEAPPPPYTAEIRAKGWRFELDYEQIAQSDTWSLAAEVPMAQHALLMMWTVAWAQVPCGSLPMDEDLIRAKCRVPVEMWATFREVLMRGWWLANDGRLYHDTLVARVHEMMGRRRSDADRKQRERDRAAAAQAAKMAATLPLPLEEGPPAGQFPDDGVDLLPANVTRDSTRNPAPTTDNRQPVPGPATVVPPPSPPSATPGTSAQEGQQTEPATPATVPRIVKAAPAAPVSVEDLVAEGVDRQHAADWLLVRKSRKLPTTVTAWKRTKAEAAKAGITPAEAVEIAAGNSWGGFKAEWMDHSVVTLGAKTAKPSKQAALEEHNRRIADQWAQGGDDAAV